MHLRPALATDQAAIQRIVRAAHINPMNLHWQHFIVAEQDGQVIGTGQIKSHGDGSRELASIAVIPDWQHRGVASSIIRELLAREQLAGELLAREPGTIYLFCRAPLETFYQPFGFRRISREEMSPYFRRMHRLANAFGKLTRSTVQVIVMEKRE